MEPDKQSSENLPQRIEDTVTWVAQITGGIYGSHDPVLGTVIAVEASNLGKLARAIVETTQQRVGALRLPRVLQGWSWVREGLEERGVDPEPEQVSDLIIEGEQAFADAETEEKRRLIARLIVNAASRKDAAGRSEALLALRMLKQMPFEAATLLGLMVAELEGKDGEQPVTIWVAMPNCYAGNEFYGMKRIVFESARRYLVGENIVGRSDDRGDLEGHVLNVNGLFLREWLRENPPAERQERSRERDAEG